MTIIGGTVGIIAKNCVITLLAIFCSFASFSGTEPHALKILFIGNSYTHMNGMPGIFEYLAKKSGKNVLVDKNTLSGASFHEHSERADMYEAIRREKWDYIILQGFSRELSFSREYIDTATVPYVRQITDSVYLNNSCTNILLYMTWGYEEGFDEREETNTYEKMTNAIEYGYSYLGQLFNLPIVPVGMVWRDVKSNSKIDLYYTDRAHPSKKGSYLIASTFYGAIFPESIDELYTKTIRNKHGKFIKQTVQYYLENNRERYNLNRNYFDINALTTENGKFIVKYTSNFPDATSVRWDFGDGTGVNDLDGTHVFEKQGKYTVRLLVTESCGERNFTNEILFLRSKRCRRKKRKSTSK
jgi:PKD domain/Domain of unknown function (DUF4886)